MNIARIAPSFPSGLAVGFLATSALASLAFAQTGTGSPSSGDESASAHPTAAEMQEMMELTKLNENHQLLAELAGDWTNEVKMWMAPGAPPLVSKGTCSRKAIMGGRYFVADFKGTIKMPDEKGQLKDAPFEGTSLEGYDNAKKKFVSTWADNMGTGIMMSEGDYDPATKTFTYTAEVEMTSGVKTKVRELVKIIDQDHHVFEYYDNSNGADAKTMEISYARKK